MNPLPETFRSDGFDFRLLRREGNVALFEKSKNGGVLSFEVVRIQRRKARFAFGKMLPAGEVMPSSERWGKDGWTFCDLAIARKKHLALVQAQECLSFRTPKPVNRVLGAGEAFPCKKSRVRWAAKGSAEARPVLVMAGDGDVA